MKKLFLIIVIFMIFVALLGSVNKIGNIISSNSSDTVITDSTEEVQGGQIPEDSLFESFESESTDNQDTYPDDSQFETVVPEDTKEANDDPQDTEYLPEDPIPEESIPDDTEIPECSHSSIDEYCTCIDCGIAFHSFTDSTGCGVGQYYSCIVCGERSFIPVEHLGDNDNDSYCDFCNERIN